MTLAVPLPMRAAEGGNPFTDPTWIYEVDCDGYRCMARAGKAARRVLHTRNGLSCTKWFPEVVNDLAMQPGGPHIIDGVLCVLDKSGRPDFDRLHRRARYRDRYAGPDEVTLCAFDLLYLDGRDLMSLPLVERKAMLKQLIPPMKGHLIVVDHYPADVNLFEDLVTGANAEGVVAKRMDSPYLPGAISREWRKVKRADRRKVAPEQSEIRNDRILRTSSGKMYACYQE